MAVRPAWLLVLVTTGCVSVNSETLVAPSKYPAVAYEEVQVFLSTDELQAKNYDYERVALMYASGSAMYTTEGGMVKKLRKEAGKKGANGIVMSAGPKDPGWGEKLFFGAGAARKGQVVAIRYWTKKSPADSAKITAPQPT